MSASSPAAASRYEDERNRRILHLPRFPKLNVRRYCPEESFAPPAPIDGGVRMRPRTPKRSDGLLEGEACPRCKSVGVSLMNMDRSRHRYKCNRCGHGWG